jgi:hypothetical protein
LSKPSPRGKAPMPAFLFQDRHREDLTLERIAGNSPRGS